MSSEVGQLQRHLGLLTSRFDALEGRTAALEIQNTEIFKTLVNTVENLDKMLETLDRTVCATERHAKIISGLVETVGYSMDAIGMLQKEVAAQGDMLREIDRIPTARRKT